MKANESVQTTQHRRIVKVRKNQLQTTSIDTINSIKKTQITQTVY